MPALLCSKTLFLPQEGCPGHADGEKENEKESSENRAETPVILGRQVTAIRINGLAASAKGVMIPSAKILDGMADRLETKSSQEKDNFENSFEGLEQTIHTCSSEGPQKLLTAELQTFLALSRSIESLTTSLSKEI